MLPIQKAQFIAQCRSYFEIHEQLKRQLHQYVPNYSFQHAEFDFNHWIHQCCQYQYELITQSTFGSGLNQTFTPTYETASLVSSNTDNQTSQTCLAKLNTTLDPYDRVNLEKSPSTSSTTSKLKLEDFEAALAATLEEANASSFIDFYKTDGDDSDELVVDTDYESDSRDNA
ncbi:hypothetical protein RN001_013624 [Aquatica leii]|uniref:Uncharacterized protein n=1 Tax=Aquatica leii TaxID=1421715 RepID=A0AAN7PQV3_9COLE|nr:hypothetical protein RN001_013624 [Aquatica leii]